MLPDEAPTYLALSLTLSSAGERMKMQLLLLAAEAGRPTGKSELGGKEIASAGTMVPSHKQRGRIRLRFRPRA
jgi:hypothetical protein